MPVFSLGAHPHPSTSAHADAGHKKGAIAVCTRTALGVRYVKGPASGLRPSWLTRLPHLSPPLARPWAHATTFFHLHYPLTSPCLFRSLRSFLSVALRDCVRSTEVRVGTLLYRRGEPSTATKGGKSTQPLEHITRLSQKKNAVCLRGGQGLPCGASDTRPWRLPRLRSSRRTPLL